MYKIKAEKIVEKLKESYGEYRCGLNYTTAFELLIATILSAQCTDKRVNIVTKELFAKANTPEAIINMGYDALLEIIKPCGLATSKASNIIKTSRILKEEFNSQVPCEMDALISLPGVGRKTANVVLSNAFGVAAIAVDTHVFRVSNRIGLASSDNVLKTERMLMDINQKDKWSDAHHWLIWHGRNVCSARKPKCGMCILNELCEWPEKINFN